MCLCGLYDESGRWATTVGLPAKSGVGGGIMATVPGKMGIGVFGPALAPSGTSHAGWKVLQRVSARCGLSIFG
jgi:glutaminase